ncbi:MAG TPA: PAS domain S-box protein [Pseudolabrys sp.]|jgi:PAS domain S-box-containing protein|nr:PAS domain S-box protein [Pseudolabrys sp.]
MRTRVRDFDWAATPLGPAKDWSGSLKWSVELVLASGFPMSVRWGPDLVIIYNDAYSVLLAERHPHVLGKALRDVWPEIFAELGPLNEAILRGERDGFFAQDHPWRIIRHGVPEEARFTLSYSPIPDPSSPNGIGGVLATAFETTERVRNEQSLRVLSERLGSEVEQRTRERDRIWAVSEDLLGVANFDGYFLSVNPAWTSLLGWSEDEIKSLHVSELRHPDDAAAAIAGRARLAQGIPTVRMENRFRHRDGSWRWIAWTMTTDDDLIYMVGRHISSEKQVAEALRESDRQFRALVAGVTDYALYMLDPNGIVSSWNAGAERIKGYTADEIIGRNFAQFYTPEDRRAGSPLRTLSIAAATGRFEAEAWRTRKDGSLFWANVVVDAIRDSSGKLIGFAKITRDITEKRNAQEALERAHQQLAQAQKMEALGQLTGGVAHDFNNLLMVVSGQAQALTRRTTDEKNRRSLDAILTAASRGETLTRQLLTFARRQPQNPRTVYPGQTVAAFRDVLASSARGKIDLRIEVPATVWPVSIDIPEFELALVNLVVNSRDAMPEGGSITVAGENVTLHGHETIEGIRGEFVAMSVTDTGVGIPPEILSKIFEPFFTTKNPGKGTGLGLSQAYGFAQQSSGALAVRSRVRQGTTVTIYLPRSHEPVAVVVAEPPRQLPGRGETILVVEDNPEVKAVAVTLLEQLNYRTVAVDDAKAALNFLSAGAPVDLVFTDVMLPGDVDGVALALAINKRHPQVPVLLTSGYAKALNARHGLPILRKPYQIGALAEAVRATLDTGPADVQAGLL